MARTAHNTLASPSLMDFRQLAQSAWAHARQALHPDAALLTACAEFRRCQAVLVATPYEDEQGTDAAFAARNAVTDRIANLRPTTDAGHRAKAAVAVTLLQEVPAWQWEGEVTFALAAFRAEVA